MLGATATVPRCSWVINTHQGGNSMNWLFLNMCVKFQELTSREDGQDLVEYALLLSLVSLALITSLKGIAGTIATIFNNVSTSLA
jgi:pilus assembly protein Flp/PilA